MFARWNLDVGGCLQPVPAEKSGGMTDGTSGARWSFDLVATVQDGKVRRRTLPSCTVATRPKDHRESLVPSVDQPNRTARTDCKQPPTPRFQRANKAALPLYPERSMRLKMYLTRKDFSSLRFVVLKVHPFLEAIWAARFVDSVLRLNHATY